MAQSGGGSAGSQAGGDELALLDRLRRRLGAGGKRPGPGEVWIGDDAAAVRFPGAEVLFALDVVVEGVHFDRTIGSLADAGWKALSVNVSDIAAMGGRPLHALCGLVAPAGTDLEAFFDGMSEAAAEYGVALVGGDLSAGAQLVASVAITGTTDGRPPVLRSGARPGDIVMVTGPLGSSAGGLERLRRSRRAGRPAGAPAESPPGVTAGRPQAAPAESPPDTAAESPPGALERAYLRPQARVREGLEAAAGGATAMIDISDGLTRDLDHIARESGVGIRLESVPVMPGASLTEALGGGEDYELAFTVPPDAAAGVVDRFSSAGLRAPLVVGECVGDPGERTLGGEVLAIVGWEHKLA